MSGDTDTIREAVSTVTGVCSICGKPWEEHYRPELLRFKMGPYGSFGLSADHTPHIPGIHFATGGEAE
jgi:hypothetical protein